MADEYISPADSYWELRNQGWTDDDILSHFGPGNPISRIAMLELRNAVAGTGSDSATALAGAPNVGSAPMTPNELIAAQGTTDILTTAPNTGQQITARVIDPNSPPTPFPTQQTASRPDPMLLYAAMNPQAANDAAYMQARAAAADEYNRGALGIRELRGNLTPLEQEYLADVDRANAMARVNGWRPVDRGLVDNLINNGENAVW